MNSANTIVTPHGEYFKATYRQVMDYAPDALPIEFSVIAPTEHQAVDRLHKELSSAIESIRATMGEPLADRDIPEYAKGPSNIPPDRLSEKQICGLSQWIRISDRWFKWRGTPSEFLEFRELADSDFFTGAELISHADWKLERWVEF